MGRHETDAARRDRRAMRGPVARVLLVSVLGVVLAMAAAVPGGAVTAVGERPPPRPRHYVAAGSGCSATVTDGVRSYCLGYVNAVTRTYYGVNRRVAVDAIVDRVSGPQIDVHGSFWCPSGYCGATMATMTVTFAPGQPVPAYGNMIRLYGQTKTGGLIPRSFAVNGQCDPYWGDC